MAGTGSVAYLLKRLGKNVLANDYLHANHQTLVAFIENPSTYLLETDVRWLLTRHREIAYETFVQDTFDGLYFQSDENEWLDVIAGNIAALPSKKEEEKRFKQALARHAVIQACLMKRPFNLFHRNNLYLRTADVLRSFGNKTTWDTPFSMLFQRIASEGNRCIFDNHRSNRAANTDVLMMGNDRIDLVYLDPPYFRSENDRAHSNYRLLYHFVEGFAQYDRWPHLVDRTSKLKNLCPNGFSTEQFYFCPRRTFKNVFLDWLRSVLRNWPNAQIVMSYKEPGIPGRRAIKKTIEETGRKVTVKQRSYNYALNRLNNVPRKNMEVLFIAK